MKNLVKFLFVAFILLSLVSCEQTEVTTTTIDNCTDFELDAMGFASIEVKENPQSLDLFLTPENASGASVKSMGPILILSDLERRTYLGSSAKTTFSIDATFQKEGCEICLTAEILPKTGKYYFSRLCN